MKGSEAFRKPTDGVAGRRAERDARGLSYDMPRSTALYTLAGTRMIDDSDERAQNWGYLHRVRGGLSLSAARAPQTYTYT